jgi:lysophospholipase L1-like esterase
LSETLGAEEVNKAIGGEIFFPDLAKLKDDFVPDYITVAYGTNDWNRIDEETFKNNCSEFYTTLSKNYPDSQIFAITPIWRKDLNDERMFGEFRKVEEDIKDIVKELNNVTLISGFSFVPEDEDFYADLRLHPNDTGFEHYFKNLYNKIMR